jgi:hypothetical protein
VKVEGYIAEVTVSVVLRGEGEKVVAEYSVTRSASGSSTRPGAVGVIDTATSAAAAAARIMNAGVQNAEARRLK